MRPTVSVVMPFAGDPAEARAALASLASLRTGDGDQLILADNTAPAVGITPPGVLVLAAAGERSPSHARNAGARAATGDWILFVDSDCVVPADLLDRYFAEPVSGEVGALAGEVVPAAAGGSSLAERYGIARSFLSQRAHMAHRFMPRAAAANLCVRRAAFDQVGGFYEGLRAAEDTDFSWRLQQAGWRLELRPTAVVEHRYRSSLGALRRQWRGYAAGRAWLARRYPGFTPEPGVARALRRLRRRSSSSFGGNTGKYQRYPPQSTRSRRERVGFHALDGLLAVEELIGLALSNRPRPQQRADRRPDRRATVPYVDLVLVAERFPAPDDPLVALALSLDGARVEAGARPARVDPAAAELRIDYREDDGALEEIVALSVLLVRHPLRCLADRIRRGGHASPSLRELAPAVRRLRREHGSVRVHALGAAPQARAVAVRLAALSERRYELRLTAGARR